MTAFLVLIDDDADKKRFEELYYKYKGLMAHVAAEKFGNREDIEEILQEAFLYIAKNFDKVGDIHSGRTKCFVCVITEGFAIDKYRKEKKNLNNIPPDNDIADEKDTDFSLNSKAELNMAMNALNDEYRNFLYLKYVFGYKSKEIAAAYGLSDAYVRKKIQLAKAEIKKHLEVNDESF